MTTNKCENLWKGYGFSFSKPYNTKKKKFAKWYLVLKNLFFFDMTKDELWKSIDYEGYTKQGICQRSWNSYVFAALAKNSYIYYSHKEKVWKSTIKGRRKFIEVSYELQHK